MALANMKTKTDLKTKTKTDLKTTTDMKTKTSLFTFSRVFNKAYAFCFKALRRCCVNNGRKSNAIRMSSSSSSSFIVLDNREIALTSYMPNVPVQQLLVGDAQIINDDQSVAFVFERKTLSDLGASIIDGRLKEQKQRLMAVVREPRQIVYIIEGVFSHSVIPTETLVKTADSLQLRDGFTVVFTDSPKHTSDVIQAVHKRHLDCGYAIDPEKDYLSCVKVRKCDNVKDAESCAILMLSSIPHVTAQKARVILKTYNACSIHGLLNAMSTRTDVVRVLANSLCGLRRLGPVLAGNVWDALH